MNKPVFTYMTYIGSTPENVWRALTEPETTALFWAHTNVSDWQVGSIWEHRRLDPERTLDVTGTIVASSPPVRLVQTWAAPAGEKLWGKQVVYETGGEPAKVTYDIQACGEIVRLLVTHELSDEGEREGAAWGWAAVVSNLKSLLETGSPLPQEPWVADRSLADRLLRG